MRGRNGRTFHFLLCDTPGMEENSGLEPMKTNFLLGGHVPDLYQVGKKYHCNYIIVANSQA